MTDSYRTSASTGLPTSVDDGAPAGHPTPVGEPSAPPTPPAPLVDEASAPAPGGTDQPELFPHLPQPSDDGAAPDRRVLEAVGALVLVWGQLEQTTAEKLASMRQAFGDVRIVGGRTRPTMQKLLAELRALVAMRDRHDKQVLAVIAEIDGALQRTAQFRILVLDGTQSCDGEAVTCHDLKNTPHRVTLEDLQRETVQLNRIRSQIAAL